MASVTTKYNLLQMYYLTCMQILKNVNSRVKEIHKLHSTQLRLMTTKCYISIRDASRHWTDINVQNKLRVYITSIDCNRSENAKLT